MWRPRCVIALAALCVGLAHSWDFAVSTGDKIHFYSDDGQLSGSVGSRMNNFNAIVYDEVHDTMLFVDKWGDHDDICGYDLSNNNITCFIKRYGGDINSLAFDPVTELLFFTDIDDRSINWISLKPGYNNNNGNRLIKMFDRTPTYIAVDSCRGYIYWSNMKSRLMLKNEYMERARFDGSQREVTYTEPFRILSLAIDPPTHNIYYVDLLHYLQGYLAKASLSSDRNLNMVKNLVVLFFGQDSKADGLAVSKDYIYWMNRTRDYQSVWQIPKNAIDEEPKEILKLDTLVALNIAANYKIKEQILGNEFCDAPSRVMPPVSNHCLTTITKQTTNNANVDEIFCVNGTKVDGEFRCKCSPGYTGERCDISVCENYCLQGNCSVNDEGLPYCSCNTGFAGERCELYAYYGYCLNNGTCTLNEDSEPVCQCEGNYSGGRCEVSACLNYCIQGNCSFNDEGDPKCRCNAGYSGERCEVYVCHGYCLNNGTCFVNEKSEAVCECIGNHEGLRCEADKMANFTIDNSPAYYSAKRNLTTLADLLSNWQKPSAKVSVVVEV